MVGAIRSVKMVKVTLESPVSVSWFDYKDDGFPDRVLEYKETHPPLPKWYSYTVRMDMGMMSRIYQDLRMFKDSHEFEYLKKSVLYEIEYNLDALIKLEFGDGR